MPIDYRSFNNQNQPAEAPTNNRWWTLTEDEMPAAIAAVVNALRSADSWRQQQMQTSARLYGNIGMTGLNGLSASRIPSSQGMQRDRISYNIVQSGVDTVTAKMIKNKPKPIAVTSGGDWKKQRRAEKLSKFVDGIFYENHAYEKGRLTFRDAGVLGDGMTQVHSQYGRVCFDRFSCSELLVDQMEAFYGEPRQIHRVRNVDRAVMIERFPDKKEALTVTNAARMETGALQSVADQITVCESWHLRSGPDAKDGLRVITVDNRVLEKEEWERDYFPFARLPWTPRLYGYWSQGGAEQIQNIQLEINKLLWVIQRSMHMAGTFKILAERGAKIVKEHFTNDFGVMLEYTGTPPSYIVPPIVPPEIYAHLQTLKQDGFAQLGVSMLSAASVKPAGLNSGIALREHHDIETERFQVLGQQYEEYYLQLAMMSIDEVKEIFSREKSYEVRMPGKKFLETINWKEVRMEDDEYVQKIFPVSSLPGDPAGRLQTIQEYIQAGMLSPRSGRRLLDFPDLEAAEQMANSAEDWLHEVLEKMIDDGEAYTPEPEDNLALAKELTLQYIAYAKCLKVDEERIQLLRDFLRAVSELTPAPQPGMTPQANPAAPPTSDLIPNVPGNVAA